MKTIILNLLTILFILPSTSFAGAMDVTINWHMPDTSNISGYKIYYSYDPSMANQILAGETNTPTANNLLCPNLDIATFPVFFKVAAITLDGTEIPSVATKYLIPSPKNLRVTSN